jgi:hypothetical protein
MKNIYFLFLSIACTCASTIFAKCPDCNSHGIYMQNIYIQSNQIAFHDNQIYIQLDGDIFVVPAIYSDQNGFYIQNIKQPRGRCEPYEWKCSICGTCNDFADYYCRQCKAEMP